jgi:hypothetical protein
VKVSVVSAVAMSGYRETLTENPKFVRNVRALTGILKENRLKRSKEH